MEEDGKVDETETDGKPDAKSEELGDGGKRALENERKARRQAESRLKEIEAKLKEAEDAEKSEVERLQGQVADLTKRAESSELTAARFEVAAAKGLTPAQARRLVGSTKEELEADADELRADLGLKDEGDAETGDEKKEEDTGLGLPKEDLKPGASNAGDAEPDTGKLADQILASPF